VTKLLQSLVGGAMVAAGIAGLFLLPERSEWVMVAVIGVGCNYVSQTTMKEMLSNATEVLKNWRGSAAP